MRLSFSNNRLAQNGLFSDDCLALKLARRAVHQFRLRKIIKLTFSKVVYERIGFNVQKDGVCKAKGWGLRGERIGFNARKDRFYEVKAMFSIW